MRIPGSEGKSSETRSLSQYFVIDFSILSISWMWLEGSSNVRISTVLIANENAGFGPARRWIRFVWCTKRSIFFFTTGGFFFGIFHQPDPWVMNRPKTRKYSWRFLWELRIYLPSGVWVTAHFSGKPCSKFHEFEERVYSYCKAVVFGEECPCSSSAEEVSGPFHEVSGAFFLTVQRSAGVLATTTVFLISEVGLDWMKMGINSMGEVIKAFLSNICCWY